ncbi:MAG: formate dehydrogenase accessory sulfurtransferase FdhD [Dehalococcoidia bacterium]
MLDESLMEGATSDTIHSYSPSGEWLKTPVVVPREMALTVYVNDEELATIQCTPTKLTCLVLGFLYLEGIIADKNDVASLRVCEEDSLADVKLSVPEYTPPTRRILSSACGGGFSFATEAQRVDSDLVATPAEVLSLVRRLNEKAELYRHSGGVHTAALGDTRSLIVVAEDIGRHNTLDKIMGECLLLGLPTKDRLLIATGRISSEMMTKAARMETPIVVSRSSPTDRAVALARELGITLIGYARSNRLSVYSHAERLQEHSRTRIAN